MMEKRIHSLAFFKLGQTYKKGSTSATYQTNYCNMCMCNKYLNNLLTFVWYVRLNERSFKIKSQLLGSLGCRCIERLIGSLDRFRGFLSRGLLDLL